MLSITNPIMYITNTLPALPDNAPVLWDWNIMMRKTEIICLFKGYWAMGAMYLFMRYPDGTRVGEIEFSMD